MSELLATIESLSQLRGRKGKKVVMIDDPPLGHMQALVLKKIDELGKDASGYEVLKALSIECGVFLDASQIYASIRKLLKRDKPYIEKIGTAPSPEGGPPFKIYRVTDAGRRALSATAHHHNAVAKRLEAARLAEEGGGIDASVGLDGGDAGGEKDVGWKESAAFHKQAG